LIPIVPASSQAIGDARARCDYRSQAYSTQDKLDACNQAISSASTSQDDLESAYYNRGAIHGMAGEYADAAADFTKAIELHPANGNLYRNRALAYLKMGNNESAISDFSNALRLNLDPSLVPDTYNDRGVAYLRNKKAADAISDFTKAIQLRPIAAYYMNRSEAYAALGDGEHAAQDRTEAIRLDPNVPTHN